MRYFRHETLLTLARKAQAAAGDGDAARLRVATSRFVDELTRHLHEEAPSLVALTPAQARLVRKGQQRVRSAAVALADLAGHDCPGPPASCAARADELLALLAIQAEDERLAWHGAVDWAVAGEKVT